jgi:hypothetical protein
MAMARKRRRNSINLYTNQNQTKLYKLRTLALSYDSKIAFHAANEQVEGCQNCFQAANNHMRGYMRGWTIQGVMIPALFHQLSEGCLHTYHSAVLYRRYLGRNANIPPFFLSSYLHQLRTLAFSYDSKIVSRLCTITGNGGRFKGS